MNKLEYKQSVSDIKAIINDRDRFRSKFGRFNIRRGLEGIWNCKTKNCIAVINRDKKFIRIRKKSVYYPALSALEGWTVVPSETLGKYRGRGYEQVHQETYINHFIRPQVEAINAKTPEKLVIDLGPDKDMHQCVMVMFNSVKDVGLRKRISQAFRDKTDRTYEIDLESVVNSTDTTGTPSPRPSDATFFRSRYTSGESYQRWDPVAIHRYVTLDEFGACDENDDIL